ncbi:uncharacterized protein LOC111438658 [Cucurbita moschata]|uniref:Uncharacterized protein LOC111438658 n=1 Tax=Cucurbita moschata TaxID=3662 RepID=A0A6J1EVZ3_CUCMO|nr:uncharacterized protein LOC111438658 [Cucurbita moschata]
MTNCSLRSNPRQETSKQYFSRCWERSLGGGFTHFGKKIRERTKFLEVPGRESEFSRTSGERKRRPAYGGERWNYDRHMANCGWRGVPHRLGDTHQGTDSGQPESDLALRMRTEPQQTAPLRLVRTDPSRTVTIQNGARGYVRVVHPLECVSHAIYQGNSIIFGSFSSK